LRGWFLGAEVDADAENLKLDGNENEQSPDDDSRSAFDMDELELESDENEFDVELGTTVCRQGLTSSDSTFHISGAILDCIVDWLSKSIRTSLQIQIISPNQPDYLNVFKF
jgi:hypothetical protein